VRLALFEAGGDAFCEVGAGTYTITKFLVQCLARQGMFGNRAQYTTFVSSVPWRLIDSYPYTGGVQSGILPCGLALLNELRQYGTGQKRASPAMSCPNILLADKVIEMGLAAIVTPDFRHTQDPI